LFKPYSTNFSPEIINCEMDAFYHDERNKISILLYSIIQQNSNQQVQEWLQQQKSKLEETNTTQRFYGTFTAIPVYGEKYHS
jgi:hypothetical protein